MDFFDIYHFSDKKITEYSKIKPEHQIKTHSLIRAYHLFPF